MTPKDQITPDKATEQADITKAIRLLEDAAWKCGTDEYREGASNIAVNRHYQSMVQARANCVNAAAALLDRVRSLEEALKPFVTIADEIQNSKVRPRDDLLSLGEHFNDGSTWTYTHVSIKDLDRARAALKGGQP